MQPQHDSLTRHGSESRFEARGMASEDGTRHFRTLFISDVHLGARGCQVGLFLDFLRYHDAETIYLVGDIVDTWRLRAGWYWPQAHNDVVQKLLRKARKGAVMIYVPGNHDEFLRDYCGTHFGGIEVKERAIHQGADGRRYLVVHGDHFDLLVTQARWLAHLGDHAYGVALVHQQDFQRRTPAPRLRLLVAVAMGEAEGQERRQLHRRIRKNAGAPSKTQRCRRCHLRPYPPCRHP
jgi:UDP-2,3-diacylglucosamine pyrophosphatase LpxH